MSTDNLGDSLETIGADIRNKLTPTKNLLALLEIYFREEDETKKAKLIGVITKERAKVKENVEYLSNLL
jgi:hypothetical protein